MIMTVGKVSLQFVNKILMYSEIQHKLNTILSELHAVPYDIKFTRSRLPKHIQDYQLFTCYATNGIICFTGIY